MKYYCGGNSSNEVPQDYNNYWPSLVAAGVSGWVAGYAGFYFEGVKKRLQSDQSLPNKINLRMWIKESFRGSGTYALCNIPPTVVQQMANHFFKEQNLSSTLAGQTIEVAISGGLGGIPAAFIGNILLEQQIKKIGPLDAFRSLFVHGTPRLFRGVSLLMVREAIFGLCYMKGVKEAGDYADTHFGSAFVLPAQIIVGAGGSLLSHPMDTAATVMQKYDYKKIKDATQHLWKENSIRAFYKGGAARVGLFTTTMLVLDQVRNTVLNELEGQRSPTKR